MEETEQALHRAVQANPHDATPRLVLADFYDDHGMPEHALAHRWLSGEHAPPTTHAEWKERTQHLDGSKVAGVLSHEAEKSTTRASRQTMRLKGMETVYWPGQRSSAATIYAQQARDASDDGGRSSAVTGQHAQATQIHETLANHHETQSYPAPHDSAGMTKRKGVHEEAGRAQRQAQDHHSLASQAHNWHDHDTWLSSREV